MQIDSIHWILFIPNLNPKKIECNFKSPAIANLKCKVAWKLLQKGVQENLLITRLIPPSREADGWYTIAGLHLLIGNAMRCEMREGNSKWNIFEKPFKILIGFGEALCWTKSQGRGQGRGELKMTIIIINHEQQLLELYFINRKNLHRVNF